MFHEAVALCSFPCEDSVDESRDRLATLRRSVLASTSAHMDHDAKICYCFHVTRRKLLNFIRLEKPRVASQLSMCGGAGTGCGWCIPFLKQLHEQAVAGGVTELETLTAEDTSGGGRRTFAAARARRRRARRRCRRKRLFSRQTHERGGEGHAYGEKPLLSREPKRAVKSC